MNYMFSLFTVCFFLPLCLISFLLVFPLSFLVYFWFFLWSIFSLSFNFFPFSPSSSSSSTLCSCSPSSPLPSIPFLSPWFSHPGPSRSLFRPSARPSSSAAWDHRHKYPGSPQRPVKGGGAEGGEGGNDSLETRGDLALLLKSRVRTRQTSFTSSENTAEGVKIPTKTSMMATSIDKH